MWSAVPGVDEESNTSDTEEENCADSHDECLHRPQSPQITVASSNNSETAPPRDVSVQHWQTFCNLKRRREDLSKSLTQGKVKKQKRKHRVGQKEALSETPPPTCLSAPSTSSTDAASEKGTSQTQEQKEHWAEINKHLHVNEHIYQGIDHGQYNPHKSGLEKKIEEAVTEGKFDQAENLSDQLATRDFACKFAKSANARDYLKWKEAEAMRRKAKRKKKKLNWGFEAKERWQMKGNM